MAVYAGPEQRRACPVPSAPAATRAIFIPRRSALFVVLGWQFRTASPYPTIEDRNGAAKDRHEQQNCDQLQYEIAVEIRELVHAAIVVPARCSGQCD
jgi:hypothetical protein